MRRALPILLLIAACSDQPFVVDVPLRVVSAFPTGAAAEAAREAPIVITFSEALVPGSVAGAVRLESQGMPDGSGPKGAVDVDVTYADAPVPTVTLAPKGKLPFSTVFKVTVATTLLRARDQGPLPVEVGWTFQTLHPPPLRVERIDPGDRAQGVSRDVTVRVTFSEPVRCDTLSAANAGLVESHDPHPRTSEDTDQRTLAGAWDCAPVDASALATLDGTQCDADPALCVVTFRPEDSDFLFRYSSHLALSLAGGAHSDAPIVSARATPYGGQLPVDVSSSWHVVDPLPLSVTANVPGAAAGMVARGAGITLVFSEPVDCTTIGAPFVSLRETFDTHPRLGSRAGTTEDVPGAWNCPDAAPEERLPATCAAKPELCTVTFTPHRGFLYEWSSDVTLTLAGGEYAPDDALTERTSVESARATTHGGQLPSTVVVPFHIVDPPALALVSTAPGNAATGVSRSPVLELTFTEPPACASLNDARIVLVEETLDSHPRISRASGPVPGAWTCPAPLEGPVARYQCDPGAESDPCRATFVPEGGVLPFEWSTRVKITLAGGLFDGATDGVPVVESTRATRLGGQLPDTAITAWRVADPPALALVGATPADGATGVGRTPAIRLTFTEPPDCARLGDADLLVLAQTLDPHPRVAGTSGPIPGAWSCPAPLPANPYACVPGDAADPCVATFVPAAGVLPFEWSTTVDLLLVGGPFDASSDGRVLESTRATSLGGQLADLFAARWRVADPPALAVLGLSPDHGATGVERSPAIRVTFSEPPSCASLNDRQIVTLDQFLDPHLRVTGSSGPVAGSWSCPAPPASAPYACIPGDAADPCVGTFVPAAGVLPFEWSTAVELALAGGDYADGAALDAVTLVESTRATTRGGELPDALVSSWRVADPPALAVLAATPADAATGVARSPAIQVTFSEPPDCATLANSAITRLERALDPHPRVGGGGASAIAGAWSCPAPRAAAPYACLPGDASDPCVATFEPAGGVLPFEWSTEVALVLAGGDYPDGASVSAPAFVQSTRVTTRGGALPDGVSARWRVVDPPALTVVAVTPDDAASGVPRSPAIKVTFSEPPACATLNDANIASLTRTLDPHPRVGGGAAAVAGAWSCPAAQPSAPYACLPGDASDPCVATLVPAAGVLPFEWSTTVALAFAGGDYADGASVAAPAFVESTRVTTRGGAVAGPVGATWRVLDPPVLAVVALTPADGASGVSRTPLIQARFSEPPDCASLEEPRVQATRALDPHPRVAGSSGGLAGSWSCPAPLPAAPYACSPGDASDPCVATFTPTGAAMPIEWSTRIAFAFAGGDYPDGQPLAAATLVESRRATTRGGALPTQVNSGWRALDPPPLALVDVSPASGATGVERSPVVRLTFSEPPRCDTLMDTLIVSVSRALDPHPRLGGGVTPVSGAWSCPPAEAGAPFACKPGDAADPCVATFTPIATDVPLEPSTVVSLRLRGGDYADGAALAGSTFVESTRVTTRGGELPTDATPRFRIEDPRPQLVLGTAPGNGAAGVPVFPPRDLAIDLAEPVECATVGAATFRASVALADGSTGAYAFDLAPCAGGDLRIALTPSDPLAPFPYSATFTVTLAGGVFGEDAPGAWPGDNLETFEATTRGGQLPRDFAFRFRTEEPPPMRVKSAMPSGGAVGAAVNAPIVVAFTEPLLCASAGAATFQVTETFALLADGSSTPAPRAVTCAFDCPDSVTARCAHALPFARSSSIEVALQGGADAAGSIRSTAATATGGWLKAPPVVYAFRAEDPAPLRVVANVPNGNPGVNVSATSDVRVTFDRAIRCATAAGRVTLRDLDAGADVPGSLACTDGANVGATVSGPTVIFTPSVELPVEHTYRLTLAAGIAAADATNVAGTIHGKLEQPFSFEFVVAHEDLRVVSTIPKGGGTLVPVGSNVAIRFNQDIDLGSLKPCDTTGSTDGCNVWVNPGSTADISQRISLSRIAYDNTDFLVVLDPRDPLNPPHLQPDLTYVVQVIGGLNGPLGANGVSRLPTNYSWTFVTSSTALVVAVEPPNGADQVNVTAAVCAEFSADVDTDSLTEGGANQLTLGYQDEFGRAAQVPLDAATPYTVTGVNGFTRNKVCLNIVDAPTPCFPGPRRLLYGTDYTARISTLVNVGGDFLAAPFTWSFETRLPPEIAGVSIKNAVIDETFAAGAGEVPVNSAFVVRFAEIMAPGSLTSANIAVVPLDGSTAVVSTVLADDPVSPRAVTVTVNPAMDHAAPGTGRYALQLLGGSGGVATRAGNYLGSDVLLRFTTSPATGLVGSPPGGSLTVGTLLPLSTTGRALYLPSGSSTTIVGVQVTGSGDVELGGIIAQQPLQARSVTYIANPTFVSGLSYALTSTGGLLDFRGNPVPAFRSVTYPNTGVQPASASQAPALGATVVPAGGGSTANGNQSFDITPTTGTALKDRMLGTSYYASPVSGPDDGTLALAATGTGAVAGCPAAGTRLALRIVFVPGPDALSRDRVLAAVEGPPFMKSGCDYVLTLRQPRTANVYNQTLSSAPVLNLSYRGEAVAPVVTALEAQRVDGSFAAAGGRTDVSGGTVIRATFGEPVDPASVGASTFSLSGVAATYEVEGNVVTLRPIAGLAAGTSYTATVNGVKDLAGNASGSTAAAFTVETTPPDFTGLSQSNAYPLREAPFGTIVLQFTEPVDPATLTETTAGGRGSVSVEVDGAGTLLFGCATIDPADPRRVLWRPEKSLAGTTIRVNVNHAGSAAKLADMAGTLVPPTGRTLAL